MVSGITKTSGADIGIATTGIAGPNGGTEEKPVGLVYVGLSIKGEIIIKKLNLRKPSKNKRKSYKDSFRFIKERTFKKRNSIEERTVIGYMTIYSSFIILSFLRKNVI